MESNEPNVTQSAEIGKLAEALAAAQAEIKGALKTSENPYYHSRYADLATVMDACREPLSKHGLAVIQTTEGGADAVTIVTTLAHSSNQWIRGRLTIKPIATRVSKDDPRLEVTPQTIGSCLTYGRRFTLAAMVGVAPEDDDGNTASGKPSGDHPPLREAEPEKKPGFHPKQKAPGVTEMLRTGQATMVPPVTTEAAKNPSASSKLNTLMELSGVSVKELHDYLESRGWLKPEDPLSKLDPAIYAKMIEDENWATVTNKIKTARKA